MYLKVGGQNLYYQKIGRGRNLVILHGWGNDASSFWGLVPLLKDNFTLYLIDLPGFGRSDLPKKPFTVSDYAQIIKEFILKCKIKKPNILGHSVGGRIAIKLAAYPKLIDKLILEDAAGIKPQRGLFKVIFYFLTKIFKFFPNFFNLKELLRLKFYSSLESDYLHAGPLKQTLQNILAEDLSKDIAKIQNQTLLIWGEKDPTPETSVKNGKKMYQLIKDSRIEIFEGVGHFPHLEKPKIFAHYVKDFL